MKTRDPFRFLLGVAVVVLILGAWGRAQFIQDPSFEGAGYPTSMSFSAGQTLTVNGWTFGAAPGSVGTVGTQAWTTPGSNGVATEHNISMHTNVPNPSHLFIETTMTGLIAGNQYSISFDAHRQGANGFIGVFLNGSATASFSTGNIPTTFTTFTFTFTATGTSELLNFMDNSSGAGGASTWNLDNIVVTPLIPEARPVVAGGLLLIGIGLVEARRIRKRKLQ